MEDKNTVWVVGCYIGSDQWELQGVFTTEQKAIDVAKPNGYFVGPVELDVLLPDESVQWPGCYYPEP